MVISNIRTKGEILPTTGGRRNDILEDNETKTGFNDHSKSEGRLARYIAFVHGGHNGVHFLVHGADLSSLLDGWPQAD